MSQAYIGQIQVFGFDFAPRGWAFCWGQTLSISQNQSLFSLIGTIYGGDGRTTFRLPNLQGRLPIGVAQDTSYVQGDVGGEEQHRLAEAENAPHHHLIAVDSKTVITDIAPSSAAVLGRSSGEGSAGFNYAIYGSGGPQAALDPRTIGASGGQPHPNIMPYLAMNFCICLYGVFPPGSDEAVS